MGWPTQDRSRRTHGCAMDPCATREHGTHAGRECVPRARARTAPAPRNDLLDAVADAASRDRAIFNGADGFDRALQRQTVVTEDASCQSWPASASCHRDPEGSYSHPRRRVGYRPSTGDGEGDGESVHRLATSSGSVPSLLWVDAVEKGLRFSTNSDSAFSARGRRRVMMG